MLTIAEALGEILKHACPLPEQPRRLEDALNCLLAEDVLADLDLPPFDKALVDGYAVRSADCLGQSRIRLRITEEVHAGQVPSRSIEPGEAASVMTGAPLPQGADAMVMVERTSREDSFVVIDDPDVTAGRFRLERGRELRAGEVVARPGDRLNPPRLGLLASVGRTSVRVVPRPEVRIVPTGNELVDPSQVPGPAQIRNSNATMLRAFVQSAGFAAESSPIVPDDPSRLEDVLRNGLEADVLMITGGVSAGRLDLVPGVLEALGVDRVFHKVRIKPGKPLWFGVGPRREAGARPGALVFGLPGNPVSGVVSYLLFVRPALERLAGRGVVASVPSSVNRSRQLPLSRPCAHRVSLPTFHPARLVSSDAHEHGIEPLEWAGSADLKTVAHADGFAIFEAGERDYRAGEIVGFLPIR